MKFDNKYFLLRHGQTIYQKNGIRINYPADADSTLSITEEGQEMIKTAVESLKKENISMIIASPALRTKLDIRMGEFSGKTYEEYENFFSEKMERFEKRPKGGENWNDILVRLKSFLNDVEKKNKGETILVIGHADPLWLFAGLLKGFDKNEQFLETRKSGLNLYPNVGELIKT